MSQLLESRVVRCPYHLAQRYLADDVAERMAGAGESVLTLGVTFPGIELTKHVFVRFERGTDPMHFDEPWTIHWKPKAGPYPEFDGELTVRADETYETALLELRGAYRPPGGAAGAAFDWAAGSHIARATALALLARIGDAMEARYQRDERAKKSSPL